MTGRSLSLFCLTAFVSVLGCSLGSSSNQDVDAAVDAVNNYLSAQNCSAALQTIYPFYNSASTTNAVRLATAATYGCFAGVNFAQVLFGLESFSGNLAGPGLWEFLAKEFPSTQTPTDDKKPQATKNGIDALFATLKSGIFLIPAYTVNFSTYNPGSILYSDRENLANSYLTLLAMALLGTLENRYGLPSANYHKSQSLPWTTATQTKGDGCAFASGLLNLKDGLQFSASSASGAAATLYQSMSTFLGTVLDVACSTGCTLCGGSVSCTTCPLTLRDRSSCTGASTDTNSCAAAGLALFVNSSWAGPP